MASNEFVVPAQYEDLTPAPQVDSKTLNRMALRSYWLQSSFNYETMQSGGWLFAMIPGLEKVHTNKNDLAASMYHNLDFINTHPFLVTFVMGIVLSLEQNKLDTQTIRAVRISAASPLGGIGDALFWLTLVPITAGITSNMAIEGNIAAPFIFLLIFNLAQAACRFGLMKWAYKVGTGAIDALTANMQAFTRAASILGVFVVGALTVTMGGTQINLTIPNGTTRGLAAHTVVVNNKDAENFADLEGIDTEEAEPGTLALTDIDGNALTAVAGEDAVECGIVDLGNGMSSVTYAEVTETEVNYSVASTLDTVLPKLVPLALVLMLYFLFAKHNFTPIKGIVLLLVLGLLGAGPFGLWPSIW
ncbi:MULTISPECIES: PTS system mannose/fructose/sorbose family transporter subunit IID [unclassified Collinsella]|uniref:PTS system mannose/fructose/sorbose family transporter subunit IID n=1 Tax=unclassified Collinsella TaxID=2637548 RepID=UPI0011CBDB3A|nr:MULTISPECIES: PTS system mannose/fructose/sorbose family transporter subunit IID [unclassified Collinsella]TXF38928.1 PTS system mannose/fructose/sorbose family transporter subunit IID [Collinsella sp. BA40]